ncbi:pantoate--beta-alanine ligase [Paludifilum halophilum]|uniref:Pantothenate synthetase n=1 Tax=Paludifilum halophilum TaxID=1642702 RepID=A0A235BDL2_9BACL|nr:pantoate--beta-alanine ligase [Paludifilum halophilum]OYD09685.1 pantoate--beta-alanine ligase [Paludifilum halophilum]
MEIVKTIEGLRRKLYPRRSGRIGLVPTMGYLHEGHLSLIRQAVQECDTVVVSVFVNPLQFGPGEDFDRYPRDPERDAEQVKETGAEFLFAPDAQEMYPRSPLTRVTVSGLTDSLCGMSRPGHFDGVATVVTQLFHIVGPDRAYFGQKDAQQAVVIRRMAEDLHFPLRVIVCPTVREKDGLAMSSRNIYLSPEERKQATVLYRSLSEAAERKSRGDFNRASEAVRWIEDQIRAQPLAEIDYVEVLSYPELEPVEEIGDRCVIAAVAVRFGQTRLIDNMIFSEEETECFVP